MKRYTYGGGEGRTFEQYGAINDANELAAAEFVSPVLVRCVVRIGRLETCALSQVLDANNAVAAKVSLPYENWQLVSHVRRDQFVDAFLDALQPYIRGALRPRGELAGRSNTFR